MFDWVRIPLTDLHVTYNAKLSRFNSRFYQPGTEAVDAFLQDWEFENNWLLPPVSQIARAVNHLRLCKCGGYACHSYVEVFIFLGIVV